MAYSGEGRFLRVKDFAAFDDELVPRCAEQSGRVRGERVRRQEAWIRTVPGRSGSRGPRACIDSMTRRARSSLRVVGSKRRNPRFVASGAALAESGARQGR